MTVDDNVWEIGKHDIEKVWDSEGEYYRVADALCDLRHFCDAKKINFYDELDMSETFYEQEKEDAE